MFILRRKGLSINQISEFTGRSTSVVSRALKTLEKRGFLHKIDKRKSPHGIKFRLASIRRATMLKLMSAWQKWICEESEKPP